MSVDSKPTSVDPATQTELDELLTRLTEARTTSIGFPAATDFDYRPLIPFLGYLLNNLGDPNVDGAYPHHTKQQEREAVNLIADLLRAPEHDRWGYVAGGASEGSEYALHLARARLPGGIVYHSRAAHHCISQAIDRLAMPAISVRTDDHDEIDYADLAIQVDRHRHRPAIVVANIGTALAEAVDDVRRISQLLDDLAMHRRWVHADAALSGIPLALLDPDDRPGFDLTDGADSIIVSGHKFLGSPIPYGVVLVRDSHRPYGARAATYTGSPDSTLTNSRSGLAVLGLWYTLRCHGIDGLRVRAEQSRALAAYTHGRLVEIGWQAHHHRHAFTVVLDTPSIPVAEKWALPSQGGRSHVICMPGVTRDQIDAFITDLQAAINQTSATPVVEGRRSRRLLRGMRQPATVTAHLRTTAITSTPQGAGG